MHEYVRREGKTSAPHGRVLVDRTMRELWPRNIKHQAVTSWYARTVDNACNRCIKYALLLIAGEYLAHPPTARPVRMLQRQIAGLLPSLQFVTTDSRLEFLNDPLVQGRQPLPETRLYYREVLDVALAIIQKRGVVLESTKDNVRLPSLVVNMADIFEAYIRRSLVVYQRETSWPFIVLDGNRQPGAKPLFSDRAVPEANPDVVIRKSDERWALVCDVKSSPVRESTPFADRDGINQVVTYAAAYETDKCLLVHPCASRGQESGMWKLGDVGGIGVYQYRFSLGADDLAAERVKFCEAVASLLQGTGGQSRAAS
jgi:5-methylcytosine-specific restriction enzyme subunit McrC